MKLVAAADAAPVEQARQLFRAYAAEFTGSISETLCLQGFEAELAGLPGRYALPSGCLLLATEGGTPVGRVALRDLGERTCELKRLFVAPEHRGGGRRQVEEVIRRAEWVGYRRMVLNTLPEMAGAVALYRQHASVETNRYRDNPIGRTIYLERRLGVGATTGSGSLAEVVQDDMAAYFEHLAARIERLVRMLSHEQLWARPFGSGSSVGRIVVHLTGSLGHYIGAEVAGTGYVWDRPLEFANPARPPADGLLRARPVAGRWRLSATWPIASSSSSTG